MTIGTILYAWAVTLLLGVVACGVESLARSAGRQARGVWAVAGLVSVFVALHPLLPPGHSGGPDDAVAPTVTLGPALDLEARGAVVDALRRDLASLGPFHGTVTVAPRWPVLSTPVPNATGVWVGLSALLLLLSLGSFLRLRERMNGWRRRTVAGAPVLLSSDFGPATVGLFRGQVVLPAWALETVDREELRMAVVHELEHVRGGDLPLLAFFGLLVVAMPWNLPLWWQGRRLTRAVELDCDRRVLRHGHDSRAYGELLIAMSGRGTRSAPLAPALGRRSLLRVRIEQLGRRTLGRAAKTLAGAAGLAAIVAACTLPTPTAPVVASAESAPNSSGAALPVIDAPVVDHEGVRALTSELGRNPAIEGARGVVALAVAVAGASGAVRRVRIDHATGPSISTRTVHATVTEVTARLRVRAKEDQPPEGWIPLWVLFTGPTVEAHLVKPELYQEKGWPDDAESLGRHMDVYYGLRTGGPGELDLSYAMAAADRPGVGSPSGPIVRYLEREGGVRFSRGTPFVNARDLSLRGPDRSAGVGR